MTSESTQTGSECWISDMGEQTELRSDDGSVMTLPRYGVWTQDRCRRRPGVIEVSDDLQGLFNHLNSDVLAFVDLKIPHYFDRKRDVQFVARRDSEDMTGIAVRFHATTDSRCLQVHPGQRAAMPLGRRRLSAVCSESSNVRGGWPQAPKIPSLR